MMCSIFKPMMCSMNAGYSMDKEASPYDDCEFYSRREKIAYQFF